MSTTNSTKFLDLFNNVDEYKQVNQVFKTTQLKKPCPFRQYARKWWMLYEHQID